MTELLTIADKMINFCSNAMKDLKSILKDITGLRIDYNKATAALNAIENSDLNLLFKYIAGYIRYVKCYHLIYAVKKSGYFIKLRQYNKGNETIGINHLNFSKKRCRF